MTNRRNKGKDGEDNRTRMPEYLSYIALIMHEQGDTWQAIHEEINRILESQGKPKVVQVETIRNRAVGFKRRHGDTFASMIVPYLTSIDKLDILKYLLGDLLIRYERAKLDENVTRIVSLSQKVQECVWRIHKIEKGEDAEDQGDAFSELIRKSLARDEAKLKRDGKAVQKTLAGATA